MIDERALQESFNKLQSGGFCFIIVESNQKTIATALSILETTGFDIKFSSILFCFLDPITQIKVIRHVLVGMRPLTEKSYVDQAMKTGTGIVWFDDCRIPYASEKDKESARFGTQTDVRGNAYGKNRPSEGHVYAKNVLSSDNGRFPANLLVCGDNVLEDGREHKGCKSPSDKACESIYRPNQGKYNKQGKIYGDSGSFSRYFDLGRWAESKGFGQLEPLDILYRYLITLGSREGQLVLCDNDRIKEATIELKRETNE